MSFFTCIFIQGSSHGASRVIRYLGDDNLSKLEYSFRKWKDLEKENGSKLLVTTGLINFGSCDTNTGECTDAYLHKHMNVLKKSGKVKEILLRNRVHQYKARLFRKPWQIDMRKLDLV